MLGHGGMVVYSAATPDGPYTIQPKNPQVALRLSASVPSRNGTHSVNDFMLYTHIDANTFYSLSHRQTRLWEASYRLTERMTKSASTYAPPLGRFRSSRVRVTLHDSSALRPAIMCTSHTNRTRIKGIRTLLRSSELLWTMKAFCGERTNIIATAHHRHFRHHHYPHDYHYLSEDIV